MPILETSEDILVSFPSLLKFKLPFCFIPIPQQKSTEYAHISHFTVFIQYYAAESKVLSAYMMNWSHWCLINDLTVTTFLLPWFECCWTKLQSKIQSNDSLSACSLGQKKERKSFVWLTSVLPLTTPPNKIIMKDEGVYERWKTLKSQWCYISLL